MSAVIRPATPSDAPALADLVRALNIHEGDAPETVDDQALADQLFGAVPAASALVADDGAGMLLGYVIYSAAYDAECTRRVVHMNDLYVADGARGAGLARQLVAAVARAAQAMGAGAVFWTSMAGNSRAHAFYDKLGASRLPVVSHWLEGDAFDRLGAED